MFNLIKEKLPHFLLVAYLILFTVLSFNPVDRPTWFVENLTIWIIVGILIFLYLKGQRFSNLSYIFMTFLVFLHTIGGHYTFALVPFDWFTDFFGFERNHYDRVAHFFVGFYAFPIAEWLRDKKIVANKFFLFTYPIFAIAFVAMFYEIIECIFALNVAPDAGNHYLGSQGDLWDAQKDMALDTLGAITAMTLFFFTHKLFKK